MKLKIIILFHSLIFIFPSIGLSQSTNSKLKSSINWGVKYKNANDEYISEIIHDDGTNIYAVVDTYKGKLVTPSSPKYSLRFIGVILSSNLTSEGVTNLPL